MLNNVIEFSLLELEKRQLCKKYNLPKDLSIKELCNLKSDKEIEEELKSMSLEECLQLLTRLNEV